MTDAVALPVYTHRVDPTDCDMLGHVNYTRYLVLFERARWTIAGERLPISTFERGATWLVVRHVDISYLAEVVPGDELMIVTGLERVGRTSLTVRQQALKRVARSAGKEGDDGEGVLCCEARVTLVAVDDGDPPKPIPVPHAWRSIFPRWPEGSA
jgi:YbgC/YbaW family acyl-CoA thioester hydrolase